MYVRFHLDNGVWILCDVSDVAKVVQHTFPAVFEQAKS